MVVFLVQYDPSYPARCKCKCAILRTFVSLRVPFQRLSVPYV
uniref:Uncharacterized protein n=1 Tax=Anopheles minimus TaxID=112268 RepID=A0A182WP31_9DIPT